jgi:S-adenosylmethionine synthetase
MKRLITTESVSIGHPDKVADQISDAILDAYLANDPNAKVAVETMVKDNCVVLGGEISSTFRADYEKIVKDTIKDIGYIDPEHGFYYKNVTLINLIGLQSPEINSAVLKNSEEDLGAGDQGFMTGYATNETDTYMPIGMYISKKLVDYVYSLNISFGPDIKTQTTIEYGEDSNRIHTLLVSTMHKKDISLDEVKDAITLAIKQNYIGLSKEVFDLMDENTKIIVNPAGSWNVGGPVSDCGVTGRKIVVDQYGPYCAVGGGAFSGKDPSKVDRSGAYLARYIAKNVVASGISDKCSVEIAYMIGIDKPASLNINTYGKFDDSRLVEIVMQNFPMTPSEIINHFNLRTPIYNESAKGHFGNDSMPWEKLDKVEILSSELSIREKIV